MSWNRKHSGKCPKCGKKMKGEPRFTIDKYNVRICGECADEELENYKRTLRLIRAIEKADTN